VYRVLRPEKAGVPIWEDKHQYGIAASHFLPPISLTTPEAIQVFLATRLLLQFSRRRNLDLANLFIKLGAAVPEPLRQEIKKTSDWMLNLPADPHLNHNLALLAQAWIDRRSVQIVYQSYDANNPVKRTIDPYFIEPAAAGRSSYVIAYCHLKKEIRTFKVERIESVYLTSAEYQIPASFDANLFLGPSLGIMVTGDDIKTVNLLFRPELARIIQESVWHPSQKFETGPDGSLSMSIEVNQTPELVRWVLGWGELVEVLEPESLRREVKEKAHRMSGLYRSKGI
jgi:predicted DNA-binding transcriptional regulator YafY